MFLNSVRLLTRTVINCQGSGRVAETGVRSLTEMIQTRCCCGSVLQGLGVVKLRTVVVCKLCVVRQRLHSVGGPCDKQFGFGVTRNY
jgi:hypothetical protein